MTAFESTTTDPKRGLEAAKYRSECFSSLLLSHVADSNRNSCPFGYQDDSRTKLGSSNSPLALLDPCLSRRAGADAICRVESQAYTRGSRQLHKVAYRPETGIE